MDIDIKNAIIIFDEAHNIADKAEDVQSAVVSFSDLNSAVKKTNEKYLRKVLNNLLKDKTVKTDELKMGLDLTIGIGYKKFSDAFIPKKPLTISSTEDESIIEAKKFINCFNQTTTLDMESFGLIKTKDKIHFCCLHPKVTFQKLIKD